MDEHKITKKQQEQHLRRLNSCASAPFTHTMRLFVAGLILCASYCGFLEVGLLSDAHAQQVSSPANPNSPASVDRALVPEREIAALKKEELELVERLMRDFPDNVNPVVLMGNIWERHGDATKAVEFFKEVLEVDPNRPGIYTSIGWFAMHKGQYEEAIGYWRKALEIDPKTPGLHNSIAVALMGLGEQDEAIEELNEDIHISPQSSSSYFLLGQLYLQRREFEKAKGNYEKAIAIQPDYTNAYYGLFTVCRRLKLKARASEYMATFRKLKVEDMKILKDRNDALEDLAQMRKGAAQTYLNASRVYQAGGNLQETKGLLGRAVELDPNNTVCLGRLASLYAMNNQASEAIRLYERISEIEPENPICHLNIGHLWARLKRTAKAEESFRKVIKLAPELSAGYRELAQLYLQTARALPEARRLAEKAVTLEAAAINYFVLGWACDGNGDSANALKAIQRAIQLEPGNPRYKTIYEHIKDRN